MDWTLSSYSRLRHRVLISRFEQRALLSRSCRIHRGLRLWALTLGLEQWALLSRSCRVCGGLSSSLIWEEHNLCTQDTGRRHCRHHRLELRAEVFLGVEDPQVWSRCLLTDVHGFRFLGIVYLAWSVASFPSEVQVSSSWARLSEDFRVRHASFGQFGLA